MSTSNPVHLLRFGRTRAFKIQQNLTNGSTWGVPKNTKNKFWGPMGGVLVIQKIHERSTFEEKKWHEKVIFPVLQKLTHTYLYHREGVSLHLSARRHTTAVCRGKDLDIFSPHIKVCEGVPDLVDPLLVLGRSRPQGYRSAGKRYGAQASSDSLHNFHHCRWCSTEADRAIAYQNCLSGRGSGMYQQQYQGE